MVKSGRSRHPRATSTSRWPRPSTSPRSLHPVSRSPGYTLHRRGTCRRTKQRPCRRRGHEGSVTVVRIRVSSASAEQRGVTRVTWRRLPRRRSVRAVRRWHKHWSDIEVSVLTRCGLATLVGASLSFYTGTLIETSRSGPGHSQRDLLVFLAYVAVMFPVGGFVAHRDVHGVTAWRFRGAALGPQKRRTLLRLPFRQACWGLLYWIGAAALCGLLPFVVDGRSVVYSLRVAGSIVLGGLTTAGVTFLLLERAMRPVFRELFATDAPDGTRMLGIRTRLLVSWALGAAIPLLIIALSYLGRRPEDFPNQVAIWSLAGVGIAVGAVVITTAARSI